MLKVIFQGDISDEGVYSIKLIGRNQTKIQIKGKSTIYKSIDSL